MSTIFTNIIEKKWHAHIIAENETHIAFLDIYPTVPGHTLVLPKKETNYFFDLPDKEMASLMQFTKKIAHAIKKTIPCKRIALSILGLEVPHVHIHLLPIHTEKDLHNSKKKEKAADDQLLKIATSIKNNLKII